MQTSLEKKTLRGGLRVLAFAGLATLISIGAASAQQTYYPNRPNQYYGLYDQNSGASISPSRQDHNDYDRSGTRGRMGLGASPFHPEGPGNATD
jgi:hypothetical protein